MSANKEAATRYMKQVFIAVAILLVLYGIAQLLNFLLDLSNFPSGYYLFLLFQIIVAVLAIFIGFRVYSLARTIKLTNLTKIWQAERFQILTLLLGSLPLLPLMLYPLPHSSLPFNQAIALTFSDIYSNPGFWLGKRVRLEGILVGPLTYYPEAVPPYNCMLYDPDLQETIGIRWKNPDYGLDGKNVWVIGVLKKERAPSSFGIEADFIEAEIIVPKPKELQIGI